MLARLTSRARFQPRSRRRGMTVVESALVLSVFLLLLFGIFEYRRFLLVLHVTNNAARRCSLRGRPSEPDSPHRDRPTGDHQLHRHGWWVQKQSRAVISSTRSIRAARSGYADHPRKPKVAGGPYPDPFLPIGSANGVPAGRLPTNGVAWNSVGSPTRRGLHQWNL